MIKPHSIKKITDAVSEPVTLAEAKKHLRVDHSDDDTYIETLITASRQSLEISTSRSLGASQVYEAAYENFPVYYNKMLVPNPPLVSVDSIKYYPQNNVLATVNSNEYIVDSSGNGVAYISMLDQFSLPTLSLDYLCPVVVRFTAGYTSLPKPLHQAILLLVAHYYDTREPISFASVPKMVQRSVDFIANQYKVRSA